MGSCSVCVFEVFASNTFFLRRKRPKTKLPFVKIQLFSSQFVEWHIPCKYLWMWEESQYGGLQNCHLQFLIQLENQEKIRHIFISVHCRVLGGMHCMHYAVPSWLGMSTFRVFNFFKIFPGSKNLIFNFWVLKIFYFFTSKRVEKFNLHLIIELLL